MSQLIDDSLFHSSEVPQRTHEPSQGFTDLVGAVLLNEVVSLHSHFDLIAPGPAKFTLAAS